MIGLFLALLELIRRKHVRTEQGKIFGTISIHLIADPDEIDDPLRDVADDERRGQQAEPQESTAPDGDSEFESTDTSG